MNHGLVVLTCLFSKIELNQRDEWHLKNHHIRARKKIIKNRIVTPTTAARKAKWSGNGLRQCAVKNGHVPTAPHISNKTALEKQNLTDANTPGNNYEMRM